MIAVYSVPWVIAEQPAACAIALKWIHSKLETMDCAGWNTYSVLVSMHPDGESKSTSANRTASSR